MDYLSCRADSSTGTCRSISAFSPTHSHRSKPKNASSFGGAGPDDADNDNKGDVAGTLPGGATLSHPRIRNFSYRELESATQNFADAALLGRGSQGTVYKAVLRSGRSVAVKRPSRRPIPSPAHEVDNEIEILSHIQNPRLVNLVGFTPPGGEKERLLVVEFMPNGTLYDLLHSNHRPPGWSRRLRLAFQTAKALLALHSSQPPIIHRDVKSANVLLDDRFNARLGDFGLALRSDGDANETCGFNSSVQSTPPAGTLGYLDPGYITSENLSTKTDVFSFGILLLEIISGRKAIDVSYSPPSVVEWAVPLLKKGKVLAIFDPRITPPRDPLARWQLAFLAASCVQSCRDRRPAMKDIVEQLKVLNRTVPARVWTVSTPGSVIDTASIRKPSSSRSCCCSPPPPTSTLPHFRMVRPAKGFGFGCSRKGSDCATVGEAKSLLAKGIAASEFHLQTTFFRSFQFPLSPAPILRRNSRITILVIRPKMSYYGESANSIGSSQNQVSTQANFTGDVSASSSKAGFENKKRKVVRPRSDVWAHFTKYNNNDGKMMSKCNYCGKTYCSDTRLNGTSNLRTHLSICPKNPINIDKNQTQLVFQSSDKVEEDGKGLKAWRFDQETVRKALAVMVIVDELPFKHVEGFGFKYFMSQCCPMFKIPSRWTLTRDCFQFYLDEMTSMKQIFKKSCKRVCLTTDTWTSIQRINYMCLTVHYIDEDWKLNKRVLNFCPIYSHRGELLGQEVEKWV